MSPHFVKSTLGVSKCEDDNILSPSGMTSSPLLVIKMTMGSCPCCEVLLRFVTWRRTSCPLPVIQLTEGLDSENPSLSGSRPPLGNSLPPSTAQGIVSGKHFSGHNYRTRNSAPQKYGDRPTPGLPPSTAQGSVSGKHVSGHNYQTQKSAPAAPRFTEGHDLGRLNSESLTSGFCESPFC